MACQTRAKGPHFAKVDTGGPRLIVGPSCISKTAVAVRILPLGFVLPAMTLSIKFLDFLQLFLVHPSLSRHLN
jgi:hypothetical protein